MIDLYFDPDLVDEHLVVTCTKTTPGQMPDIGERVAVDDGSGEPLSAVVLRSVGSEVLVRILQPHPAVIRAIGAALWPPKAQPVTRRVRRRSRYERQI